MKRILMTIALASIFAIGGFTLFHPSQSHAENQSLPTCATDGDMDGDGVLDADDSDETDSCLASSTGDEDCTTGAGDGHPDCE